MRLIRNLRSHFEKLPNGVKIELCDEPGHFNNKKFLDYFFDKFPKFFIVVYETMRDEFCKEDQFEEFYKK